jgi:hypothetical protein
MSARSSRVGCTPAPDSSTGQPSSLASQLPPWASPGSDYCSAVTGLIAGKPAPTLGQSRLRLPQCNHWPYRWQASSHLGPVPAPITAVQSLASSLASQLPPWASPGLITAGQSLVSSLASQLPPWASPGLITAGQSLVSSLASQLPPRASPGSDYRNAITGLIAGRPAPTLGQSRLRLPQCNHWPHRWQASSHLGPVQALITAGQSLVSSLASQLSPWASPGLITAGQSLASSLASQLPPWASPGSDYRSAITGLIAGKPAPTLGQSRL